ncbi:MAG: M20/M25/M40 family metallo-hydrolase [Acidobacteriaceae bacterium]|nr:M20/M25/M40 family metallo-hydrolase [Acidobacteriaceae bacterium]
MRPSVPFVAVFSLGFVLHAQDDRGLTALHQIKVEAFDNSKVMDHLQALADRYGPRLTASAEWEEAAQWAMQTMRSWGLSNVHEERWGPFGRSWSLESCNLDMVSPRYSHLVAYPMAWSSSSNGVETGELLYAPMPVDRDYEKFKAGWNKYKSQWHGKLKGKIVLVGNAQKWTPSTQAVFRRYTAEDLAGIANAPAPVVQRRITIDKVKFPENDEEANNYFLSLPNALRYELSDRSRALLADIGAFFKNEGVIAVLKDDQRAHDGLVFGEAAGSYKANDVMAAPTFVVTEEQYSRMQRLVEKKEPVTVRLELRAKYSDRDVEPANIIAEIPGQKTPDEVVMVGAHFDSWHMATGATDNGAGSAVMMEVMRILKTLHLSLDRTVRIGLWSGEEQGHFGSREYVKQHFADMKTGEVRAEYAKLDAYLNLDNGSGKIRGVYLEGNDTVRPLFEKWLAPFRDMGVTAFSLKRTFGTDHQSFDDVGIPGFQFIQDPLDYGSITHHSDMDTYSHAVQEDLMQASAVIATLVYDIAGRDEMVPRKIIVQNGKLPSP